MKLEQNVADQLVAYVRAGALLEVALPAVGVKLEAFDELIRSDDELRERLEQARATAEVANVALVRQAAQEGNWLAAAWLLERLYPDRYARPSQRSDLQAQPLVSASDALDDLEQRRAARRAHGASS